MLDLNGIKTELQFVHIGDVNEVVKRGDYLYAALAAGGIDIVDATNPREPSVFGPFDPTFVAAHLEIDGEVLVASTAARAFRRYDLSNPMQLVAATSGTQAAPVESTARGEVKAVRDGVVIIQGGTQQGFELGQDVAIFSTRKLSAKEAFAKEAGMTTAGEITAVVRLERVEASESLATLGRGDSADPGDTVWATREPPSASVAAPHWIPFNWRMGTMLRPYLGFNGGGTHPVGLLADVYLDYYVKEVPLRLEVGLLPFGLVAGSTFQHNPLILDGTLAFYSPYLEVGLGGGVSVVATGSQPLTPCCNTVVGTFDQSARFGALDGFNFTWHSAIGWAPSGFEVAMASGAINIPLATRLTLYFDGGGGEGFAYTDLGLRTYVGGLGGPGTVILTGGIGFASISDDNETVQGPSLLLGLELRL